jgi:hypothetical protein
MLTLEGLHERDFDVNIGKAAVKQALQPEIWVATHNLHHDQGKNFLELGVRRTFQMQRNLLMLFKKIIAVYSENHTKHINTLWVECRVLVRLKRVVHIITTLL